MPLRRANLQARYDHLVKIGGGCLMLTVGQHTIRKPLQIHSRTVKIKGMGKEHSTIHAPFTNAIEVKDGAKLILEDLKIVTESFQPKRGTGIYVPPKSTADLYIDRCSFETVLGAITYKNYPDKTSLGNIEITNSYFEKSCVNSQQTDYPTNIHKVMLWGRKGADKILNVSFNKFAKHPEQRRGVIELCIWGDPSHGMGKGELTLISGHVVGNLFRGATRECLAVSDHQRFIIKDNIINDSNRIGLYAIRGYRSVIVNNIVNNSAYRGHRVENLDECIWRGNACYNTGLSDNAKEDCGGMLIHNTRNTIVTDNIILAAKGYAIAISNNSTGNIVGNNLKMGRHQKIYIAQNSKRNLFRDTKERLV